MRGERAASSRPGTVTVSSHAGESTRHAQAADAGPGPSFACVAAAWQRHERELLQFLRRRVADRTAAEDLLQEVFLKAMRAGRGFCVLEVPRAWLFQVARTTLIDHHRTTHPTEPLPESGDLLPAPPVDAPDPVDELAQCLDRALGKLAADDAQILRACDLQEQRQNDFAAAHGLTLAATKARLRRARQRLRQELTLACGVQFDAAGKVCGHGAAPP